MEQWRDVDAHNGGVDAQNGAVDGLWTSGRIIASLWWRAGSRSGSTLQTKFGSGSASILNTAGKCFIIQKVTKMNSHFILDSSVLLSAVSILSGTPTKRQVSKSQVSKRLVSKRLKRQVYKTSGLQNVRFQNVWFQNVQFLNFIYLYNKKYRNCQLCIPK